MPKHLDMCTDASDIRLIEKVYDVRNRGTYEVTGTDDSGEEQGACTLPDGQSCDVWDYYNGVCTAESG